MTTPTVAESAVRTAYAAFERRLRADDPIREHRDLALARFEEQGFPTTRDEAWRFTNPSALADVALGEERPSGEVDETLWPELGGPRVVFVDGAWSRKLTRLPGGRGLGIRSLTEGALPATFGEIVARDHALAPLNLAFAEDAAIVVLERGAVVPEPIHLVFVQTATPGGPRAVHPRVHVTAERGSEATMVASYVSASGARHWTNALVEIAVGPGAQLVYQTFQRESTAASYTASLSVTLARDARFSSKAFHFGSNLAREDIFVRIEGEGAECVLDGLLVGSGDQHLDTHSLIDHVTPHGTSRELYKTIMDDRARGVFHGRIVVEKGAQKTDARQANRNLLLSRQALVNSTPQLEIFADDVRCKHGSTTGQLDEAALFYLRSRGISEPAARGLLVHAFAAEVMRGITVDGLRRALAVELAARLPGSAVQEVA